MRAVPPDRATMVSGTGQRPDSHHPHSEIRLDNDVIEEQFSVTTPEPFALLLPVYIRDSPEYLRAAFHSAVHDQTLPPDHVLLVRVATAAVVTALLGGGVDEIVAAVSNAWADGGTLRAYRQAPNAGSRKSWAAGDATSRGVRLALLALAGEMAYPSIITAPTWGFDDAFMHGRPIRLARPFGSYVMEHVLFKVRYPAEFHAQTAVEAAVMLHPIVAQRLDDSMRIELTTQESAVRIISKTGPLYNPADRDHSLQYMVAVGLLKGDLTANDYADEIAADPRIDTLREKMIVIEDVGFSRDYLDAEKRSIANTVQVFFHDGTATEKVTVEYPLGHPQRRAEAIPLLEAKFAANIATRLPARKRDTLLALWHDQTRFEALPVHAFMDILSLV